jgi:hypothetical protein
MPHGTESTDSCSRAGEPTGMPLDIPLISLTARRISFLE